VRITLAAGAAVLAAAAAVTLGGGIANASPVYSDTSLQAFATDQTCINPSSISGVSTSGKITFTSPSATETLTNAAVTNASAGFNGVLSTPSGAVTVTSPSPSSGTALLTFSVNDNGCTIVESATVTETSGAFTETHTVDQISLTGSVNENSTGSVEFLANNADAVNATEGNLPGGLVSGQPLVPGSATPGTYNDLTVTVTDAAGASATGTFDLKVNGHATKTPHSYLGTVVNSNGMCLDVRNAFGHGASGDLLQIWSCGAAGGEDQQFSYSTSAHQLEYSVTGTGTGFCVAEVGYDAQAELETCGASGTTVTYSGGHYRFSDGTVLDDAGFGRGDGNRVVTWAYNGGSNQDWSLPE
jgi:hypothetical protein